MNVFVLIPIRVIVMTKDVRKITICTGLAGERNK